MSAWVLLLRGINVGGHGKLPMADLRAHASGLGAQRVASVIQSGNLVFAADIDAPAAFAAQLETTIEAAHGFRPRVLVTTRAAFAAALEGFPFAEARERPDTGHIWFCARPPDPGVRPGLEALTANGERCALAGPAFYLHAPKGIGRSRLATRAERLLGVPATSRKLSTCIRIAALADALPEG